MPRKFLKRWMPDPKKIRERPGLQFLGKLLHDPNLFHLNRHSVSVAFMVGLFICFLPIPGQLPLAAAAALILRCNLPITIALIWISNPLTFPVIFYAAYKVGAWMLQRPASNFNFEASWEWFTSGFLTIWQPLVLGCLSFSLISALTSYCLIQWFWRWHVSDRWRQRRLVRSKRKSDTSL
jgi:uncharacterized protein (DUF2062 family)